MWLSSCVTRLHVAAAAPFTTLIGCDQGLPRVFIAYTYVCVCAYVCVCVCLCVCMRALPIHGTNAVAMVTCTHQDSSSLRTSVRRASSPQQVFFASNGQCQQPLVMTALVSCVLYTRRSIVLLVLGSFL